MQFCPECNNLFNISKSKLQVNQTGGDNYNFIINKIINNEEISQEDMKNINLDDLSNSPDYKKLAGDIQDLVFDKVQMLLPKNKKKVILSKTDYDEDIQVYFICNNCGFSKKINETTLIFSNTLDDSNKTNKDTDMDLIKNMYYSDIVWRTRKYICPNTKCESHTDQSKREAKIFHKKSYNISHICMACNTIF